MNTHPPKEHDAALPDADGWRYIDPPDKSVDDRKYVTLEVISSGMRYVSIRTWRPKNTKTLRGMWLLDGIPIRGERVIAWRDIPIAAMGEWRNGKLYLP